MSSDPALRVLLVSDSYPPLIGGATGATRQLALELTARGHAVEVITAWQADTPDEEVLDGIRVRRVRDLTSRAPAISSDPYRHTPPPWPDPEAARTIAASVRWFRPDVVHSYGWLSYSAAAAIARKRLPFLLSIRDYGQICPLRTMDCHSRGGSGPSALGCLPDARSHYGAVKGAASVVGVRSGRALLRRVLTGEHAVSSYTAGIAARYLSDGLDIPREVIPDFRSAEPNGTVDSATLDRLPDEPFILFVGALRRIKGLDQLLAAHQSLSERPPLVLIGTRAPDTPDHMPADVTVIPGVSQATVMEAWGRALFGVAPSVLPEPLGNVVHEAMARGRTVIGTFPGGHSDIIDDGVNGRLVAAGDVEALARAMQELVANEPLRASMERAARDTASAFTAEAAMPRFVDLYRRSISAHSPRH